ncbi:MAG: hypothetical protein HRU35_02080 [Rickettsiaceae bacterium]|nr:hypothetical protein [Rickettsiaceae bacterium]
MTSEQASQVQILQKEIEEAEKAIEKETANKSKNLQAEEKATELDEEKERKAKENLEREEEIKIRLAKYYETVDEIKENDKKIDKIIERIKLDGDPITKEEEKFILENQKKRWDNIKEGDEIKEKLQKSIDYRTELAAEYSKDLEKTDLSTEQKNEITTKSQENKTKLKEHKIELEKVETTQNISINKDLLRIRQLKECGKDFEDLAKQSMLVHWEKTSDEYRQNPDSDMAKEVIKLATELGVIDKNLNIITQPKDQQNIKDAELEKKQDLKQEKKSSIKSNITRFLKSSATKFKNNGGLPKKNDAINVVKEKVDNKKAKNIQQVNTKKEDKKSYKYSTSKGVDSSSSISPPRTPKIINKDQDKGNGWKR